MEEIDVKYLNARICAKIHLLGFEVPITEEQYTENDTYQGKDGCTYNASIEVYGHPLMVSLHISRDCHVYAGVTPRLYLSSVTKDKANTCLQTIREALPPEIKAYLHGNMIRFSSCIWDKCIPCNEEVFDREVGKLLVITATCMDAVVDVLCGEKSFLDPSLLRKHLFDAEKQFRKKIFENDQEFLKWDSDNDDDIPESFSDDDDYVLISDTDDETDTTSDDEDAEPIDKDTPLVFLNFLKEIEKKRQDEKYEIANSGSPSNHPEYRWLKTTDFTPREKDILTFFKTQMEKKKEK